MKNKKNTKNNNKKNYRIISYIFMFALGLILIIISFFFTEQHNNHANVCCGLGTGIITSLLVTIHINVANEKREYKKLQQEKQFLFNDIIISSLDIYNNIVYKINEYIILEEVNFKGIYSLYKNCNEFNEFETYLKSINMEEISDDKKKHLNKLFDFANYRIDCLTSNIKHLPRQEYFLRGILTQEEYKCLVGDTANDIYLKHALHINDFWDGEIIDLKKCINFLKMTIIIASRTISTFDYAIEKAKKIDDSIRESMEILYFEEIYSKSEEYIQSKIDDETAKWEYYAAHPEELDALMELNDRTEEDFLLDELNGCIFGFSEHNIEYILNSLDKNSDKVKRFFNQDYVFNALKKKKIKKIISKCYGKDYLDTIS